MYLFGPLLTFQIIFETTEGVWIQFQFGQKVDIFTFTTIYVRLVNSFKRERTTCIKLSLEYISKMQKLKKKKSIVSLKVMDFIHYKELFNTLKTYVAAFGLLILLEFHIKQEELINQKTNSYFTKHQMFCSEWIFQQLFLLSIFHYHMQ